MTKRKTDFDTDWDVDKYRREFEPENHWHLRRKFMLAHKETYPEDRLVSLAQLFINIECLGCRYPDKSMQLIDELSQEVAEDFREDQKGKLQRTCVGASSVAEARAKGSLNFKKSTGYKAPVQFVTARSMTTGIIESAIQDPQKELHILEPSIETITHVAPNIPNNLVKSQNIEKKSSKGKSKEENDIKKYTEALKIIDKIYTQSKVPDPSIQAVQLHQIIHHHLKLHHKFDFKALESGEMQCDVHFLDQIVASGNASTKKLAKNLAVKNALVELRKIIENKIKTSRLSEPVKVFNTQNASAKSIKNTSQIDFKQINEPINISNTKKLLPRDNKKRNKNKIISPQPLVFMFRNSNNLTNYTSMVNEAVNLAKQQLSYEFEKTDGPVKAIVSINQESIASGVGETQKIAKEVACHNAYKILQESCYTVKVKHTYLSDKVIDQKNVSENKPDGIDFKKIDDENIGNKLLRMMGWQGGGLGKQEQGIEAPVGVNSQFKRSGLGHTNSMDDFKSKMDKLYQKLIQGEYGTNDLVFSNQFSKDQRETMHQLAHKYGLKSHSHGTGHDRHLVVSLKKSPWEIVQDLLQGRGKDKYELIQPTSIT